MERPFPEAVGRYRVHGVLGQGAMGRVLLAHDPVLDRDVAVKLLRDDLGIPPEHREALVERMRQEARASARVSHPNLVALHDMGEDPDCGLFLVFEHVVGDTLKDRLERGAIGPAEAARIARELGDGLATAHAAGVVHRDVKPENVILSRTGAKLADFGIARVPDSTLTRDGGLLGTPAYAAPEAIAEGSFSPASDQFSLAATLYEALSGRRAFPGDDAVAVASRIRTEHPPPFAVQAGLDRHVDSVLDRALAKSPAERFVSCDEFGLALAEALEVAPRNAMPTLPDRRHRSVPPPGRAARVAVGGAAVGALVAVAAFQLTSPLRAPRGDDDDRRTSEEAPPPQQAPATPDELPVAWLEARVEARPQPARPPSRPAPRSEAGPSTDAAPPDSAAALADAAAPPVRPAEGPSR